ncbi:DUF3025 domain-containing protein [Roseateles koreensis]|uniref:DUF3025 domain-containing protein n=1 Tax=Roseateles koreensis TaxID=2987526 RepID=A0ABT5KRJ7_9BURK|nr:DUF3025 domain-containing protein [Roseateles koreensis]MDC8785531.1 DUF3025 domain-containing protein [Roseateles koreensis]
MTETLLADTFALALEAPWCAPYRLQGQHLLSSLRQGASVAEALNASLAAQGGWALAAGPLGFVPQQLLPEGEGYEAFIARSGCVPTRDNAHDLLNGLIWLHWPQLKTRLNALHLQELQLQAAAQMGNAPGRGCVGQRRGPVRDALTVLDENAAFMAAPEPLCQALQARDWHRLFVELRPLWAQARLQLVGHALLEKLMRPRKPICAHVLLMPEPCDGAAAETLGDGQWLAGKPFLPLPVLGVPGWWSANQAGDFYADVSVFRPPVVSPSPPLRDPH